MKQQLASASRPVTSPDPRLLSPDAIKALRQHLELSQRDFWAAITVTQSGGSRYESGRAMSDPVAELFRLVYIEGLDLDTVKGSDAAVGAYLKAMHPQEYAARLEQALAAIRIK